MSDVIQKQKSLLWLLKLANLALDKPSFKNSVIFKATFRAAIEFQKDKLSKVIEEFECLYKKFDEIDEQLDEEQLEIKNLLGEIIEDTNLFFKKFDEDEEGEKEKELKNIIIEVLFETIQPVDKEQK